MIVRMGLIERLPSLSPEAFSAHWRGPHGTAASQMPNLRRYEQNHVFDNSQLGLAYPRGPWKLDGFSELWFDDLAAMRTAISSDAYAGVAIDTPTVMTMPGIIAAEPNVVQPLDRTHDALRKRMSILRRRDDVSPEAFKREWFEVHAGLVAALPGVAGYVQNLIVARESAPNVPCSYEALPIGGIVELWFPDADAIGAAFASAEGRAVLDHARSFIAEITTFLVEPYVIVGSR
jgi:uncharacterized protein (TIGR02118 family)